MEPDFPRPQDTLSIPKPSFIRKKDPGAKPQMQFIMLNEQNKDPLRRQGRPPDPMTYVEVSQHNTPGDTWTVINSKVYDISSYIEYHPGGNIITSAAGKDGTHFFQRYHPWVNINALLDKYQVGYIDNHRL